MTILSKAQLLTKWQDRANRAQLTAKLSKPRSFDRAKYEAEARTWRWAIRELESTAS